MSRLMSNAYKIKQLEEDISRMKRDLANPNDTGWYLGDPYEALQEMESQLSDLRRETWNLCADEPRGEF